MRIKTRTLPEHSSLFSEYPCGITAFSLIKIHGVGRVTPPAPSLLAYSSACWHFCRKRPG